MPLSNLQPTDQFDQVELKLDATIDAVNEIAGGTTGQIWTKDSATDFDGSFKNPSSVNVGGIIETGASATIKTKVIEIGDWNMDTDATKSVTHLLDQDSIRSVNIIIRSDVGSGSAYSQFNPPNVNTSSDFPQADSAFSITTTSISMRRRDGGFFDSSSFDATSYNRGWITITYES